MTALCVGGPCDGRRIELHEFRPYIEVIVDRRDAADFLSDLHGMKTGTTFKAVVYHAIPFSGNSKRFHVYAMQGTTPDTVIELLIDNYLIPKTTK